MNSLVDQSSDSNLETSPYSQADLSSSVQQQPPGFSEVTFTDNMHKSGKSPFLRITVEPEHQFYFRYKSENNTNHGYLKGSSTSTKTCPTVELVNYTGIANIKCQLWQCDKNYKHPHKLTDCDDDDDDEYQSCDTKKIVPDDNGHYYVQFKRLRIVHTAKKDVVTELLYSQKVNGSQDEKQMLRLRGECRNIANTINLNIVRLRFSAHDIEMDKEICPPVYSQNIRNAKSASTKDLKICKYIPHSGRAVGGDDVILLTDKVEKRNICVRFFVLDENGERVWQANAKFMQCDVHRQSAIAIRTPPYKDPEISSDVKAYMELFRPSDGFTSDPKEFTYRESPYYKHIKRRKIASFPSPSCSTVSGGSIQSRAGVAARRLPVPPEYDEQWSQNCKPRVPYTPSTSETSTDAYMYDTTPDSNSGGKSQQDYAYEDSSPQVLETIDLTSDIIEDDILELIKPALQDAGSTKLIKEPHESIDFSDIESLHESPLISNPVLGQPNAPEAIVSEAEETDYGLPDLPDFEEFLKTGFLEYVEPYIIDPENLGANDTLMLSADCGKQKDDGGISSISSVKDSSQEEKVVESEDGVLHTKTTEGPKRKTHVDKIKEILKNVNGLNKPEVRDRLEQLFEVRFPNGDTLLHAILGRDQSGIECMGVVKLIHSMKMPHLLNLTNDLQQSILHLAIISDLPNLVTFLVSKGVGRGHDIKVAEDDIRR